MLSERPALQQRVLVVVTDPVRKPITQRCTEGDSGGEWPKTQGACGNQRAAGDNCRGARDGGADDGQGFAAGQKQAQKIGEVRMGVGEGDGPMGESAHGSVVIDDDCRPIRAQ